MMDGRKKANTPAVKLASTLRASQHTRSQYLSISLTRQGVMYLVVNLILLLTAINYSNHNILLVAFFLLSLLAVSLLLAVHHFMGMEITLGEVTSVFLGQEAQLPFMIKLKHSGDALPVEIQAQLNSGQLLIQDANLCDGELNNLRFGLNPGKRGRHSISKVQVITGFPFGLVRVRQTLIAQRLFWVYPKPLAAVSRKSGNENHESKQSIDSDDSITLRQYRLGDSVRRIHKKSLTMGKNILVKDVDCQAPQVKWLMWDKLQSLACEKRLQILTQQVLDTDRKGWTYGLSLPNGKISPATGEAHKHNCLRMLAEY